MMKEINKIKLCIFCRKEISVQNEMVVFQGVEIPKLRLFEEVTDYRYESFNIPEKRLYYFCSKTCAIEFMRKSLELFVSEIIPKNSRSNTKF